MHILICDDDAAFAAQMDEYISEWFRAREIQVQSNVYGDIPHQPICTFYGKIADLPAMLYENGFLQVGRSDVVNLQYVRSIRNYKVELRSGVELNASRQDFPAIRSAWLEWKGQFGDE